MREPMDIFAILNELSKERPIYANEADFQHALAWQIHLAYPDSKIRMEVRPANTRIYLDIVVENAGRRTGIELKYKTKRLDIELRGETFTLADHSAQDTGRYDVLKDIQRLEEVVKSGFVDEGWMLFLTNDSNYWSAPSAAKPTIFEAFRLTEGRIVAGELAWGAGASSGSIKTREEPIRLYGEYTVNWSPYSKVTEVRASEFQYVSFHISAQLDKETEEITRAISYISNDESRNDA